MPATSAFPAILTPIAARSPVATSEANLKLHCKLRSLNLKPTVGLRTRLDLAPNCSLVSHHAHRNPLIHRLDTEWTIRHHCEHNNLKYQAFLGDNGRYWMLNLSISELMTLAVPELGR